VQPREFFFDDLLSIFGKISLSCKTEFLEIQNCKKLRVHVTGSLDCSGLFRREVTIDVWKYLQTIDMGLYAVCAKKLASPDRVLSPNINATGWGYQWQANVGRAVKATHGT